MKNQSRNTSRETRVRGFTLLELLVSLTVLSLMLVLVFSMLDRTQATWANAETKVSQFREARNAFELVTRRVSQAVLNTYWNYERVNQNLPPTDYVPYSELHFVCGPMRQISASGNSDSHGIFFQAPLGYTVQNSEYDFSTLLNSCGFFIEYNDDGDDKPQFVKRIAPDRERYRLMEFRPPAEEMAVYEKLDGLYGNKSVGRNQRNAWFETQLNDRDSVRPIAENIVALIFRPMNSELEDGDPTDIAPQYEFDSRGWQGGGGSVAEETKNQLPPLIEITMVAVSERSMIRYQQQNDESAPGWAQGLFDSNASDSSFESDLEALKTKLTRDDVDFRVFQETVTIRASKWTDFRN